MTGGSGVVVTSGRDAVVTGRGAVVLVVCSVD